MLDGTEFFECACHSPEHVLKFDVCLEDNEIYSSVFLNDYRRWYERLWVAIKYLFGYKCQYGHWDCFLMLPEDAKRMAAMCEKIVDNSASQ